MFIILHVLLFGNWKIINSFYNDFPSKYYNDLKYKCKMNVLANISKI